MLSELLTAIESSAVAEALRFWRWAYPLVNAAHILGVALLFGAILPLDLRLLGLWRSIPLYPLARVLVPVAGSGLGAALLTGPLLFSVDPFKYAGMWLFWLKLSLVALAALNVLWVHSSVAWRKATVAGGDPTAAPPLGLAGAVSALVWLLVILCGRLLAYL